MELGNKIKNLRIKCQLTQEELADRCDLTKGYISQLENELTSPSISTLTDILSALGTNLSEFFSDEQEEKVVFTEEDFFEKATDESVIEWLIPSSQKNIMEPIMVTLKKGSETENDIPHEGEEFGYVLKGEITIMIGKKQYVAKKGNSFYFTTDKPHHIKNTGEEDATYIWVSSPPNF